MTRTRAVVASVPESARAIRKGVRVRWTGSSVPCRGTVERRHGLRVWVAWDGIADAMEMQLREVEAIS